MEYCRYGDTPYLYGVVMTELDEHEKAMSEDCEGSMRCLGMAILIVSCVISLAIGWWVMI